MSIIPKNNKLNHEILINVSKSQKDKISKFCRHFGIPVSFFLRYEGLRVIYLTDKKDDVDKSV